MKKLIIVIAVVFATMSCNESKKTGNDYSAEKNSTEKKSTQNQWTKETIDDKYGEPTDKFQKIMVLDGKLNSQPIQVKFTLQQDSTLVFQVVRSMFQIPYDTENVIMLVKDEDGNEMKFVVTALYGKYVGILAVQKESEYETSQTLISLLDSESKLNFLIENSEWKYKKNQHGTLIFKKQ